MNCRRRRSSSGNKVERRVRERERERESEKDRVAVGRRYFISHSFLDKIIFLACCNPQSTLFSNRQEQVVRTSYCKYVYYVESIVPTYTVRPSSLKA